jgi:hypothetical protein
VRVRLCRAITGDDADSHSCYHRTEKLA